MEAADPVGPSQRANNASAPLSTGLSAVGQRSQSIRRHRAEWTSVWDDGRNVGSLLEDRFICFYYENMDLGRPLPVVDRGCIFSVGEYFFPPVC